MDALRTGGTTRGSYMGVGVLGSFKQWTAEEVSLENVEAKAFQTYRMSTGGQTFTKTTKPKLTETTELYFIETTKMFF